VRTPVLIHTSRQDPDRTEALADALAELLVSEYRRRHPQHNQQDQVSTVASPRGINHADVVPPVERHVAISLRNDGLSEGITGRDQ